MLAFFTNSLGVITYAEFKTLFYQSLAKQVKRVFRVPEYRRSRWAKALQNQSAEVDNLNISSDFRLDYSDFTVWLLNIGEGLHAPAAAENYKKLAGESFQNGTLTVANAFYLFSEAYAETLLQKGSNVICNHAFGFAADDVKAAQNGAGGIQPAGPVEKQALILHMEYFYFTKQNRSAAGHDGQKKDFLRRYFAALETFRRQFPPQSIEKAFKSVEEI